MARDAFGIAAERGSLRAESNEAPDTGEGVDAATSYPEDHRSIGDESGVMTNGHMNGSSDIETNGIVNGTSQRYQYRPDSWIPIEEHCLAKPVGKIKIISIGCGFSGR